jgi:hypothetical protein
MAKSKLRQMAEAGDPWAIATLKRCVWAGIKGAAKDRILRNRARPGDEAKAAMRLPPQPMDFGGKPTAGLKPTGPFYDGDEPPWDEVPSARDPAFAEAMQAAREIREWTDGPRAAPWRIYRLAQALKNA